MATDYDAPRRTETDDVSEDSLEELKARRNEAQSAAVDVDETDTAENFELPGADLSGEELSVRVVPKQPWHMNLDFPTSLAIGAPDGVTLAKQELKKGDADKLDENSAEYSVKFTPAAAGDKAFTGKFKFAVCQDEACSPVTEEVAFKVAVK